MYQTRREAQCDNGGVWNVSSDHDDRWIGISPEMGMSLELRGLREEKRREEKSTRVLASVIVTTTTHWLLSALWSSCSCRCSPLRRIGEKGEGREMCVVHSRDRQI